MNKESLLKLAHDNPEVAKALLYITKTAAGATNFDESVPAVAGGQPQDPNAQQAAPAAPAGAPQAPAGAAPMPADQQALQMAGQGPAPVDPSEEGAKAARSFLAPAFQAAATGDVNAQRTLAVAAGEIAKGVASAANEAASGAAAMPPPATPEEQVADQVVAAPDQAKATEEKDKGEGEGEGDAEKKDKKPPFEKKSSLMFSAETMKGIVELVRQGII